MEALIDWAGKEAIFFLSAAYGLLRELYIPIAVFLVLLAFKHRRNFLGVVGGVKSRGLIFNICTYLLDSMYLALPIWLLADLLRVAIIDNNLSIFPPSSLEQIPDWFLIVLAVFAADFIGYFRHRIEHSRLLWPAHLMHHSDDDMTWLTLFRFHPINRISTVVIDISLMTVIGFPLWAIITNWLVRHYYGMFIHARLPWTFGPLGYVFVSPAMHRWHHVAEGEGIKSNFATVFSIFDRAFGTYYVPGPCDSRLGVVGVKPNAFAWQLIYPVVALWNWISGIAMRRTEIKSLRSP